MAFIESTGSPEVIPTVEDLKDPDFQLARWVNVGAKVGENVRNIKSVDTLWVQFVIKNIFDGQGMSKIPVPLKVDGIYGDKTKAWIQHFQSNPKAQAMAQGDGALQARIAVHPDGTVTRVPPGEFEQRRQFTAYRLNKVLAQADTFLFVRLTNAAVSNSTLDAFIRGAVGKAA